VLLEVNRQRTTTLADLERALARGKKDDSVLLRIQRGTGQLFMVVKR
jgi:S1-C subfamily serine protease